MTQAVLPDFDAELEQVKRARANIDLLRKQRMGMPKGEMIGKQYVAPHWAEYLAPAIQSIAGIVGEKQQGEKEVALSKAMQAGADQWMGARPQATSVEQAGPVQEGEGPLMSAPIQPSQQEKLAWAQQGQRNPLTKALASAYEADQLIKEPERQAARAATAQEHDLQRQATNSNLILQLQHKHDELEEKIRAGNLNRDQIKELKEAQTKMLQTVAQIGAGSRVDVATITGLFGLGKQALANEGRVAAVTAKGPGAEKPTPPPIIKAMRGMREAAEGIEDSHSSFKPEYGGWSGAARSLSGEWNPVAGKASKEAADWWKSYELQSALVERHEKFGTALSGPEIKAWKAATITPGLPPDIIKANLAKRKELADKVYEKGRQEYVDSGYHSVGKAFPSRAAAEAGGGIPEGWSVKEK